MHYLATEKNLLVESTKYVVKVMYPLGHSVIVDFVSKQCPLRIHSYDFPANLMLLPINEFDAIWGMDWLTAYDTVVNFQQKSIVLICQNDELISVESTNSDSVSSMILVVSVQKFIQKGSNIVVDALSRKSIFTLRSMNAQLHLKCDGSILAELRTKPLFLQNIQELQFDDLNLLAEQKMVESGQVVNYSIGEDNNLYFYNRLYVPYDLQLKQNILNEAHNSIYSFWGKLDEALGTKSKFITAFHLQMDGQSEWVIQVLEDMLRHCILEFEVNWEKFIPLV
ncbi:integrase [Gossypium australe]|uniref:Integrase n=1 Tax=Gossypium australe TaxID=47621 RepID=A0A5B6VXD9_9ROSI|nr:integrase [Gossypium australe]